MVRFLLLLSVYWLASAQAAKELEFDPFGPTRMCAHAVIHGFNGEGLIIYPTGSTYSITAHNLSPTLRPDDDLTTRKWPHRRLFFHGGNFENFKRRLVAETRRYEVVRLFERAIRGQLSEQFRVEAIKDLEGRLSDLQGGWVASSFLKHILYGKFDEDREIAIRLFGLPMFKLRQRSTDSLIRAPKVQQLMLDLDADANQILLAHHVAISIDRANFTAKYDLPSDCRAYYLQELADRGFFSYLIRPTPYREQRFNEIKADAELSAIFPHHAYLIDRMIGTYNELLHNNRTQLNYSYRPSTWVSK